MDPNQQPPNGSNPESPPPVPSAPPAQPLAESEGTDPSKDERNMAVLAHILTLVSGFIAPLIIWLIKKDDSPFVDRHGKESLNFQITLMIAWFVSAVLAYVLIGCFLAVAVFIFQLVVVIKATIAASKGEEYQYPICLRIIS